MISQPDFGNRMDLMRLYADGPTQLRAAWDETPEEARMWRPDPSSWSAREIICHCADSEIAASTRIRMLAVEREPLLVGYDQDLWVNVLGYHDLDPNLALAVITAVRAWTMPTLMRLSESQWSVIGTHTESGAYSAHDWLTTYSVHLRDHADQLRANLRAWNVRETQER